MAGKKKSTTSGVPGTKGTREAWNEQAAKANGKAAGPIRNQEMADYADALIAFPGQSGTYDTIRRATRKGLVVKLVENQ